MKKHITIGELAKLMNVSTHQIRYFEEKEILFPEHIDENGYRMYGTNEIYTLGHILLLRRFNISVADIKKCFETFSSSDYMSLLKTSVDRIEEQIKNLLALRDFTKEIIEKSNSHIRLSNKYRIQNIEERKLHQIAKLDTKATLSAKQIYEYMHDPYKNLTVSEIDMINLYDKDEVYICTEVQKDSPSPSIHTLIGGDYLCYGFSVNDDNEFEQQVNEFLNYVEEQSLVVSGRLIAIENSMISMLYNDSLYYELQILISRE